MLEFVLYENGWAGGSPDPKLILEKMGLVIERKKINPEKPEKEYPVVSLYPSEISELAESTEFDVMFINYFRVPGWRLLCFDAPGKAFRQR